MICRLPGSELRSSCLGEGAPGRGKGRSTGWAPDEGEEAPGQGHGAGEGGGRAEQRDLVREEVREAEWGPLGWGSVVPALLQVWAEQGQRIKLGVGKNTAQWAWLSAAWTVSVTWGTSPHLCLPTQWWLWPVAFVDKRCLLSSGLCHHRVSDCSECPGGGEASSS